MPEQSGVHSVTSPTFAELDALPTDELRSRAFEVAESRRDLGFFWDLIRHLPSAADLSSEDGSTGNIAAGIVEVVEMSRELLGGELGEYEQLFRARFIDYLLNGR